MVILVTGAAGFIGMHVSKKLLETGYEIVGIDMLNDYYDVNLKINRLKILQKFKNFHFYKIDLSNRSQLATLDSKHNIKRIIHLAAQAGVRYSLINPHAYIDANINGFLNILEYARHNKIEHLVYASSSSVYGGNTRLPFSEENSVDHPVSLYAATKKANELFAHTYSHLYGIPTTGLRFFTVYGPWGRPDMALFAFTKAMIEGKPIDIYNEGKMLRDFTYIDDIVEAIIKVMDKPATPNPDFDTKNPNAYSSFSPYRVFNVGNNSPVNLLEYINTIEKKLGITAEKNLMPMQPGDVASTAADTTKLFEWINFKPATSTETGISNFINWYKQYYNI